MVCEPLWYTDVCEKGERAVALEKEIFASSCTLEIWLRERSIVILDDFLSNFARKLIQFVASVVSYETLHWHCKFFSMR